MVFVYLFKKTLILTIWCAIIVVLLYLAVRNPALENSDAQHKEDSMSVTGLEGPFSRMRVDQARVNAAPVKGDVLTVQVMSPQQQQDVQGRVQNLIDARRRVAETEKMVVDAQKKVADARAGQARALAQQEEGRAQLAQAQANIVALDADSVKILDAIAGGLQKMQDAHKANPANVAKIEALRQQIVLFKENHPADLSLRRAKMAEFKQQATVLIQGLKK